MARHVVVVAATNHGELLDRAVWRRFQVRLSLPVATKEQRVEWLKQFEARAGFSLAHSHENLAKILGSISFAELELFARSLPATFGLDKVPFLHAQPTAALIPGITAPKIENAASVEFTQWPKSLRELAAQLGAAAGETLKATGR